MGHNEKLAGDKSEYMEAPMAAQGYPYQKAQPSGPSEYEKAALAWAHAKEGARYASTRATQVAAEAAAADAREQEAWNRMCSLRLPQPEGVPGAPRPVY
jgi:hypothetical protein